MSFADVLAEAPPTGASRVATDAAASLGGGQADDWLPQEAPLAMPVQDLAAGTLAAPEGLPSTPRRIFWRRAWVMGGTVVLTLLAAYQIWWVTRGAGTSLLEGLLLALFLALFAWIATAFTSA